MKEEEAKLEADLYDVQYNYYGNLLATCDSEQRIAIWQKESEQWEKSAEWKAHNGPIYKVSWANPSLGNILASCSFDHTVIIWKEKVEIAKKIQWNQMGEQLNFSEKIVDVKFSPYPDRLLLGVCVGNGKVHIVKLPGGPIIDIKESIPSGVNAMSWNPSIYNPPTFALAINEKPRDASGKIPVQEELLQIYSLSEKNNKIERIWKTNTEGHTRSITDVAWAPLVGRSFHLIATCSKDHTILIWRVNLKLNAEKDIEQVFGNLISSYPLESIPYRLSWNAIATILVSSDDKRNIKTFKLNTLGSLSPIANISTK